MFRYLLLFIFLSLSIGAYTSHAIVDPLSVPNNRIGIHIFSPDEIIDAAKLVNSSGVIGVM